MPQMYSGAWQVFSETKKRVLSGEINLVSHLFRVALMGDSWVPDLDAQSDWNQISSHEIIVGGYTAGAGNLLFYDNDNVVDQLISEGDPVTIPVGNYTASLT